MKILYSEDKGTLNPDLHYIGETWLQLRDTVHNTMISFLQPEDKDCLQWLPKPRLRRKNSIKLSTKMRQALGDKNWILNISLLCLMQFNSMVEIIPILRMWNLENLTQWNYFKINKINNNDYQPKRRKRKRWGLFTWISMEQNIAKLKFYMIL